MSCEFTKYQNPNNPNYLVMHYSKLHGIYGFKTLVPNDGNKDETFANNLMNQWILNDNYIFSGFYYAALDTYDPGVAHREYIRLANQNDRFWDEGTVTGDTITGSWDIITVEASC